MPQTPFDFHIYKALFTSQPCQAQKDKTCCFLSKLVLPFAPPLATHTVRTYKLHFNK